MSRVTYKRKIISDRTRDELLRLEDEVKSIIKKTYNVGITIIDETVVYYVHIDDNDLMLYDEDIDTLLKICSYANRGVRGYE